jgi:hypothetical protein
LLSVLAMRCASFGTIGVAPSDAGAAAVDAGPDAAGPFCAGQDASFCADFDEDPDAAAGWSAAVITGSGVMGETTTAFVSTPRAFSSRAGAQGGSARLAWTYSRTAHRTALSFQMKIPQGAPLPVDSSFAIAELDCSNPSDAGPIDWSGVWLAADVRAGTSTPDLEITAGGSPEGLGSLPAEWSLVEIVVDWGPSSSHVSVALSGTTIVNKDYPVSCLNRTDAFLSLGVATSTPQEVLYDNVTLDVGL